MKRNFQIFKIRSYAFFRKSVNDSKVRDLHLEVVNALKTIISNTDINNAAHIADIAFIKSISFNTNIDRAARYILLLTEKIRKVPLISEVLAAKLAFYLVKSNVKILKKSYLSKRLEGDLPLVGANRRREIPKRKVDIIFVASMSSYLGMILKIAPKLSKNYAIFASSAAVEGIDKDLLNENVYIIDDYISNEHLMKFGKVQDEALNFFDKNQGSIKKSLNIQGIDFFSIYKDVLPNIWKYVIPQSDLYFDFMHDVIKAMRPNHIIGIRVRKLLERATYAAAKKNNIATNIILHSRIGCTIEDYYSTGHFDLIDNAFVWGENDRIMIQSDLLSRNCNVRVVGGIDFTKERHVAKLKNDKNKFFNILFAATRDDLDAIDQLIIAAKKVGGVQVTIKPHPNYKGTAYAKYSSLDIVTVTEQKLPIEQMMTNVDLLVTTFSGSHLYAASYDIPILLLALNPVVEFDLKEIYGLSGKDSEIVVTDKRKLYKFIKAFKYQENTIRTTLLKQREYIDNLVYVRKNNKEIIDDILAILNS